MTTLSLPDAPYDRWLEAARARHSRRSFDGTPLAPEVVAALQEAVARWRPSGSARITVLPEAPEDIFRGIVGGYGRIAGAPSALVMIGNSKGPVAQASVGFAGEAIVLEATALGVGTCWVGGMFDGGAVSRTIELAEGESVLAVSPLGTPLQKVTTTERVVYGMRKPKPRKPVTEIAPRMEGGDWPTWTRPGVEAARIAPSAHNRQPWRFRPEAGSVVVSFDGPDTPMVSKRLDCGIAMLHFEIAVRAAGVAGSWALLEHRSDVARFSLGPA